MRSAATTLQRLRCRSSSGSGADPPAAQVQILNPRIDTEELEGKFIALDIPAEDVDGAQFNIAMQVQRQRAWGARSAYYLASLLAEQLKTGKSYEALRPVVGSICWTSMTSRTKVDKCSTCKWLNSDDHPLACPRFDVYANPGSHATTTPTCWMCSAIWSTAWTPGW